MNERRAACYPNPCALGGGCTPRACRLAHESLLSRAKEALADVRNTMHVTVLRRAVKAKLDARASA